MQRSTDRILTTHAGSLARPADLLAMVRAKEAGQPYDHAAFAARVRTAVAEVVGKQVDVLPGLKAGASTPPDGSAVAPAGPRPFLPALNGGVPRAFLMVENLSCLCPVEVA